MQQEQVIINSLLHNEKFCRRVMPFIQPEYFPEPSQQEVFKLITNFVGKYNCLPTKEALMVELGNKPLGEGLHNSAVEIVQYAEDAGNDMEWLMKSTEVWAQERAVYNGIMRSISILEGKDKKADKNIIPTIMSQALAVCFDNRIGHNYFKDAEAQYEYYHNPLNKIPFSLDILNKITKGGVTRKTLSVVQAGINVGKTTFLINMADSYLEQGLNVVYFTMEVAEEVIRERADVCFNQVTFDQLRGLDKATYMGKINALRNKTKGEFIIREFPTGTAHIGHLRHVLNELKLKEGFVPDVIIVDYLTIMLSSLIPSSGKSDSNTYFTSVAEELRSLMIEFNAIGWTAAQFNRGGQTKEDTTLADIGLAIGVAATVDFMLAFMCPEELANLGKVLGKVLKNRFGNKQTILRFMLNLDNDLQSFSDSDDRDQKSVMEDSEYDAYLKTKKPTPLSDKATDWKFG